MLCVCAVQETVKARWIDVATGDNRGNCFLLYASSPVQHGGNSDGGARFNNNLVVLERKPHGFAHLIVTHDKSARQKVEIDWKCYGVGNWRHNRIADRALPLWIGNASSRVKRPACVVKQLGFNGIHLGL